MCLNRHLAAGRNAYGLHGRDNGYATHKQHKDVLTRRQTACVIARFAGIYMPTDGMLIPGYTLRRRVLS